MDNIVQTFQLETSNLRGRVLRMGEVLDEMLIRHGYPEPVTRLTGEAAVLAVLLSSMLKYDGIFTLQLQGDGPVKMVVADLNEGVVRSCARYEPEEIIDGISNPMVLMGKGYLAFTVDQGQDMERYQGVVALSGKSFADSVQHYFMQSEQITTGIRMAMDRKDGKWRAGAIMLQQLPEQKSGLEGETGEDAWRTAMVLLESCTDQELLDPNLSQEELLFRLFNEEGVRVYDPQPISEGCRCSYERAENILGMMSPEERLDMTVDGKITVKCEFCSREYAFDPPKVEAKLAQK